MERAIEPRLRSGFIPLVGRQDQLKTLASALVQRRSCLVSGPRGIGKTRLIDEALALSRQPAIRVCAPARLHGLLVDLAEQLCRPPGRFGEARNATSIALKPRVEGALRSSPHCVVLDDMVEADPRMYRFLQQLYYVPGVCLVVAAKSRDSLGYLRKLLWDPRAEIPLQPLTRTEGRLVFEAACEAFRLDSPGLDEFRTKVLASARGNPGKIVTMCRMAGRPEYRAAGRIKFLPLRIDALVESI
jgi:hypothetical protein